MAILPTFFIPHGGGPCFFMEWDPPDTWTRMGDWLRGLAGTLPARPRAIVVISAHWEEPQFTVTANPSPALIYDYSGFPPHTYELSYAASGAPDLAHAIDRLAAAAGITVNDDRRRGFDHGVFIPFKLIYPDADLPIVQLSLKAGLDPEDHLAIGRALAPLRDDGVLLVGSGMSYHNLRGMFSDHPSYGAESVLFDGWLHETLTADTAAREQGLRDWAQTPTARGAHPREEHLLPLMVVAGAAKGDPGQRVYHDQVMGITLSGYRFG